jgi:hypothetical protein
VETSGETGAIYASGGGFRGVRGRKGRRGRIAPHFDRYTCRGVQHIARESQLLGEIIDERAKTDALNDVLDADLPANGRQHFKLSDGNHEAVENLSGGF